MKRQYKIINYKASRYAIADRDNNIVDDAQGWGYKTRQSAQKAMWYKFKGGKKKINEQKIKLKAWLKNETNKKAYKYIKNLIEVYIKEIARNETTMSDIYEIVEEEFNMEIPSYVKTEF